MALVLLKRDLDVWAPGEHNGTFRGYSPAFVTATEALATFWRDDALAARVRTAGERVGRELEALVGDFPGLLSTRGRGLAHAIVTPSADDADAIAARCFEKGLLVETAGAAGDVVKLLPPLTVDDDDLKTGLAVLGDAVRATVTAAA